MNEQTQDIEIDLLLEAMFRKYGYDFRNYARASIERRILHQLSKSGLSNISEMQGRLLADKEFFKRMLLDLSINVTEMFRDASFYVAFREKVVPYLRAHPFIRIWIAGCATGEEVYSMAIVLQEEGLFDQTRIYATDINEEVLQIAKEGVYSLENIQEYTLNYQKAGGQKAFSDYYTAHQDTAVITPSLKTHVVFASHNLVHDAKFNEMHLISCRNVMIYFNQTLKDRVLKLFHESLCPLGLLCLGSKESVQFSAYENQFDPLIKDEKIYKKKGF